MKKKYFILIMSLFIFSCVSHKKEIPSLIVNKKNNIGSVENQIPISNNQESSFDKTIFNEKRIGLSDIIESKRLSFLADSIGRVRTAVFYPNEYKIMFANSKNEVKIFNLNNGKIIDVPFTSEGLHKLQFNSEKNILSTVNSTNYIKLLYFSNTMEYKKSQIIKVNNLSEFDISKDNKYLVAGNGNATLVYDLEKNEGLPYSFGQYFSTDSVKISYNNKYLINSGASNLTIWDFKTGKEIKTIRMNDENRVEFIFSKDNKYLICAGKSIRIFNTADWDEVFSDYIEDSGTSALEISPDGKHFITGDWDGRIRIWELKTFKQIAELNNTSLKIKELNFSDDGKYFVSVHDGGGSLKESLFLWKFKYDISKARIKEESELKGNGEEIKSILPKNSIVEIDAEESLVSKPINGFINKLNFEVLNYNNSNVDLYTLRNSPVYVDTEQTKIITNIEKGRIFTRLYYSKDLNLIYIEDGKLKGWINPDNIDILENQYNKVVFINNNTSSYKNIDGQIRDTYNSGDVIEVSANQNDYFYSEKSGWINKKDVMVIDESNKNKRIFINTKESKFNNDFTGYNYKNVPVGTEYILLGTTDKYNLVSSKLTGEKGWILKNEMSSIKPDLNDPIILITSTNIDENNVLTISGKIYDDTDIDSFLLNGNKMSTKPLNTFDKLGYIPEVGYSFASKWFLMEGMENNIEIKVIDKYGKSYSKILKYTPELKIINLNDFKIENVVKKLPKLEYITELKDSNGDNILTGSEKMALTVKVTNGGEGEAKNVTINLNNNSNNNLNYRNSYTLGTIQPNETKIAVIDISGQDNIANGKALFDLQVNEQNGFNPFPAKLSFNVEPKLNPKLEIIDYAIDDENKNGQIEQGEKFNLYVLVQNIGEGDSKNTTLELNKKVDGIIPMDETSYRYDVLKSGESKKVKFSFVTNYLYKGNGDLPFDISIYNDKDTSKSKKPIILTMNKVMPTIKEVNLEAKKKEIVMASKISLMSDIDDTSKLNSKALNPKKWAVVVGVENYKKAPDVEFAERDALVTKEYFNKLLGVPKENIFYLSNSNATKTELETLLTSTLKNRVSKDDEVYFYFSGHGVPTNEGDSYLLLNDSDPSTPKISGYSIKKLYEDLGSLKTIKSYAFLDTCFSGGVARGNEKDSLLGGTRAIMKVNDIALAYNNLTVYTATGKDQLSNSFKEQGHGLFTYYMLKGLGGESDSNKDGKIDTEELQNYIKSNVSMQSRKLYGESRYQEPTLKNNISQTIIGN